MKSVQNSESRYDTLNNLNYIAHLKRKAILLTSENVVKVIVIIFPAVSVAGYRDITIGIINSIAFLGGIRYHSIV